MEQKIITVGFVNDVQIQIYENGEKLVPVKPICEALNIDYSGQSQRLKEDPILSSVMGLSPTTGKDGKTYEMQCLPVKYVFGWLFRIDSRNVKEEAREALLKYQMQCYDVLYDYFTAYMRYVKDRQVIIDQKMEVWHKARDNFKNTKSIMDKAWDGYNKAKKLTFEDYQAQGMQFSLFDDDTAETAPGSEIVSED